MCISKSELDKKVVTIKEYKSIKKDAEVNLKPLEQEVKEFMEENNQSSYIGYKELAVLQPYCENDMRLLKRISQSIFMRFNEPLTKADYDDFYSIANMTLWQAYNSYNPYMGISFEGFLHTCLQKKFKTELTHRHRQKRILNQFAVSLDK